MLKKILFILTLMLVANSASANIVNNTGSTAADSISPSFFLLDSSGHNLVDLAAGDSLFIHVYLPNGAIAYEDSVLGNSSLITTTGSFNFETYSWKLSVANIDGAGRDGLYSYIVNIWDISLDLLTPFRGEFQLYQTRDYNTAIDSLLTVIVKILDSTSLKWVRPTVAGRTLDISAGGTAGLDWANIDASTSTQSLIGTTIGTVVTTTTVTNDVGIKDADMAAISDSVADEVLTGGDHNIAKSLGRRIRELSDAGTIHTGTSDNVPANTSNTISLQTGGGDPTVSSVDDFYNGSRLTIVGGTGVGQPPVLIVDYTGSDQSANIRPTWFTIPDATTEYSITPAIVHSETSTGSYEGGAVWISSSGSTTALVGVDGTIENPIDDGSLANARIVADAKGFRVYRLLPGSNITLDENYDTWEFTGSGYTVALGGQSVSGARFIRGQISGVGTGSNRVVFRECVINDITLNASAFLGCALNGLIKMSAAANYRFHQCFSGNPDGGTVISFGTSLSQSAVFQDFQGALVVDSMGEGVTDSLTFAGSGQLTFNASVVSGVVEVRGAVKVINNGTLTSLDDDMSYTLQSVGQIAADSIWLSLLEARDGVAGSFGDSAKIWGATADVSALALEASLTDTSDTKLMLLNNLFARLSQDTVIEITVAGNVIIASINEDGDTIARFKDSTSFQGEAGSLTVSAIVDGVWDELQSGHTTAGTFGKFLDTEVSSVSSPAGDGAFSIVWVLIDSSASPDTTLRAAPLYINNVAQSSQPLFQLTDNDGEASFNLDADDWVIFTTEPGYSNNIDTFTVTGAGTDTLFVFRTAGSLTQVAFDLREANGSFLSGAFVRVELVSVNDSLLSDGTDYIFTPVVSETEANSSGLAIVDMYPNSIFTNDSTFWEITIYNRRRGGRKQEYRMRVSVSDTVVYPQFLTRWNRDDD